MAVSEFRRHTAGDIVELIALAVYQLAMAVIVVFAVKNALPRIEASFSHVALQAGTLMHGSIASLLR